MLVYSVLGMSPLVYSARLTINGVAFVQLVRPGVDEWKDTYVLYPNIIIKS